MIRIGRLRQFVVGMAALVAVLTLADGAAQAQTKPFMISGAGVGPNGLPLPGQPARSHWSIGVATHMGLYYGDGFVQTDSVDAVSPPGHITGKFGGGSPYVFTAANGDKLTCWYGRTDHGAANPGTFDITILDVVVNDDNSVSVVVEASFIAEFVAQPDDSTGKYAGVTGSWFMYAKTEPFVLGSTDPLAYSWVGVGSLTFKKGK
jgi:hypothetical protein